MQVQRSEIVVGPTYILYLIFKRLDLGEKRERESESESESERGRGRESEMRQSNSFPPASTIK